MLSLLQFKNFSLFLIFCDAPEVWQTGFQDPATPSAEGMSFFYNSMSLYLIVIGVSVFWMLYKCVISFNSSSNSTPLNFTHSSVLEIVWTIIPSISLLVLSTPSFTLLYSLEELTRSSLTLKIIGHQWYWSYEYSDYSDQSIKFDAYMCSVSDLYSGSFRLLEVDNRVYLPINTYIRLLITADDVLHCWTIPSFGLKVDACPGRLSQAFLFLNREGTYYGQCSEICGVNHGFMPIVVVGVTVENYLNWVDTQLQNLDS
jgi:cytochrome c oxidase subunit 2